MTRSFICPYQSCQKVYGSEGSLNLHIKIKHNGGNKTDREKLAKSLIVAHMKGAIYSVIDAIDLNLPPGTISKAAKTWNSSPKAAFVVKTRFVCQKLRQTEILSQI